MLAQRERWARTTGADPDRGPVQRVSEPPWEFKKPPSLVVDFPKDWTLAQIDAFRKDWDSVHSPIAKTSATAIRVLNGAQEARFSRGIAPREPDPRTVEGLARSGIQNKVKFSGAPFVPIEASALARSEFDIEMNDEAHKRGEGPAMRSAGACDLERSVAATERALDTMWKLGAPVSSVDPPGTKRDPKIRAVREKCEAHAARVAARYAWRMGKR